MADRPGFSDLLQVLKAAPGVLLQVKTLFGQPARAVQQRLAGRRACAAI